MWREGVGKNKDNVSMSKLVRAEAPLRRHGRGNSFCRLCNQRFKCMHDLKVFHLLVKTLPLGMVLEH
ncbi:hypothetical protein MtrunA17_Chr5g0415881 [Medicago truncatula]|nr:hypothetical protein MtrunA17_Chr5g0415881 [Medicago truncatula]